MQYFRSARGAVQFLLLLLFGATLILVTSATVWPDLAFGSTALLFFVLSQYAARDPAAQCSLLGMLTFSRKWMPAVHLFLLFVTDVNWRLALLGCAFGYGLAAARAHTPLGRLALPEKLYALGPLLHLGDASSPWRVQRVAGQRLGE